MDGSNFAMPPVLATDGSDYEDWKILLKRWLKFSKFSKNQIASAVSVKSLSGEARALALSIDDSVLDTEDGIDYLLQELDKLFLKDSDTRGYESWKKLTEFS